MGENLHRIKSGKFQNCAYNVCGQGVPVMLVHGFPADHTLWERQVAVLHKECQLLLPDIPGTGESPIINDISIADIGDFLKAIIDQEHLQKCIIIGHSMGGYATLAFADKYPNCLIGLGLFHSSAYADDDEKKIGRRRSIRMMEQYGQEQFLKQMLPNLFSNHSRKEKRILIKELIQKRNEAGIDALIPYYHAMCQRPDRTEVLRKAQVPVMFFIGKEDIAAPLKKVIEQVKLPKISQVNILEDVAHLGMLEAPETSTAVIYQFIQFCLSQRE